MSRRKRRPRSLRKTGACSYCGHVADRWPRLRHRVGRRLIVCCPRCFGPHDNPDLTILLVHLQDEEVEAA